jgi:hypothetical protein
VTEAQAAAVIPQDQTSFVYQFCSYSYARSDLPLFYAVLSAYSIVASVTPSDLMLRGLAGGPVPSNFWAMCVGHSGRDRKSFTVSQARDLLGFAAPSVVAQTPGSSEALIESLCQQPTQVWLMSEMGEFLSATQGQSYLAKIKTEMTDIYDGHPIQKIFAKGKRFATDHPRLSILAAVTPSYLARHTEPSDWEGGFLSRFACGFAQRERTMHVDTSTPAQTNLLHQWLYESSQITNASPCEGLEPDALIQWVKWYEEFQNRTQQHADRLSGQIERTFLLCKKIALLNAWDNGLARMGVPWKLSLRELLPAIAIAELHWQSVSCVAHLAAWNKDVRDRRDVMSVLSPHRWMSLGAVAKAVPQVGLKQRLLAVLEILQEEGQVLAAPRGAQTMYRSRLPEEQMGDGSQHQEEDPAHGSGPDRSATSGSAGVNVEPEEEEESEGRILHFPGSDPQ